MAAVTFVKLLGTVFAGSARSSRAAHAHDPHFFMLAPMVLLAGCCLLIGACPALLAGALDRASVSWGGSAQPDAASRPARRGRAVPLAVGHVGRPARSGGGGLRVFVDMGPPAAGRTRPFDKLRTSPFERLRTGPTWDCGYARPEPRMQYSGSSFSQMLVGLLSWALWPRTATPVIKGAFPPAAGFKSDLPDTLLDRGLRPALGSAGRLLSHARVLQRGPIQVYLLYVVAILLILFCSRDPRRCGKNYGPDRAHSFMSSCSWRCRPFFRASSTGPRHGSPDEPARRFSSHTTTSCGSCEKTWSSAPRPPGCSAPPRSSRSRRCCWPGWSSRSAASTPPSSSPAT